MGLITGLLTLPLAPVRGTVWVAERIAEQAAAEAYDESAIRAGLIELDEARAAGTLAEARVRGLNLVRDVSLVRAVRRSPTRVAEAFVAFGKERLA